MDPRVTQWTKAAVRQWRRLLHEERGLGLIELLVTLICGLVVFGAATTLFIVGLHSTSSGYNRVGQVETAQAAIQRLVHDIRQASSVTYNSSSSLSYTEPTSLGGSSSSITFSCSGTTCTRSISGGSSVTAITSVASTSVFTASPSTSSPTYIGITIVLSATGHQNVTLTDGTDLRDKTQGT